MSPEHQTKNHKLKVRNGGYISILVLAFSGVFATILFGLTGFVFVQNKASIGKENREKAVQIAEAGLDYYKWFLAHNPEDLQNGTGVPGPYVVAYNDPEGGQIGSFSLEIDGNEECNAITSVDIVSTGWTNDNIELKRTVSGKYSRPSVAEYASIFDTGVWMGGGVGKIHSNAGIRMDGPVQSIVTSAVENWLCTSSFGCSPDSTEDGVFGSGSGSQFWEFPAETIDFVGITQDLVNMKTQAQSSGMYFPPVGSELDRDGYRAVFKNDGTFDMYQVLSTGYNWGWSSIGGWQRDYNYILNETFLGNYSIPSTCSLIFVEDKLWLEGVVSGKVTIAAADVSQSNYDPGVVLSGSLSYTAMDGTDGITVVAENNIHISLYSPDDMTLNGILVAQKGLFGRNYYTYGYPSYGYSNYIRNNLDITGTLVSKNRAGTTWVCPYVCSGYNTGSISYDRNLATDPPPLTPFVDDEYTFIEWLEVE